jgi:hypothetical protein
VGVKRAEQEQRAKIKFIKDRFKKKLSLHQAVEAHRVVRHGGSHIF